MKLFHTSPDEITKIDTLGRFGEFLFFSTNAYKMTSGNALVYSIDIDENDIIRAGQLFYHAEAATLAPLVSELAGRLGIDEADAESLIDESKSSFDIDNISPEDAAELSWDVQHMTAKAAKMLGFTGVVVNDEQGAAYMIDMLGRDGEIVKCGVI